MVKTSQKQFPASVRVAETLEERILRGLYPYGAWLPTERELADEFSLSRPVIRHALAQLAERGVILRAPGCRPRVNGAPARTVGSRKRRQTAVQTIAAVLPQQPTYVSAHAILRGINQTLVQKEAPYRLVVFDTYASSAHTHGAPGGGDLEKTAIERIEQEEIAGVIIWHLAGEKTLPDLQRLHDKGLPLVFIDRYPAEFDCDYVGVDNRSAVREAVEYLFELGHRRIAHITSAEHISTVAERLDGYREAFLLRGMAAPADLVHVTRGWTRPNWKIVIERFRALPSPPTAAVILNDFQAFSFMREAQTHCTRIPQDLSVIGFDDIESYSPHPAILTTIHQPFYQIGQRAAELLLRRLTSPPGPAARSYLHVTLPTSLVQRSTCRPLDPNQA